MSVEQQFFVDGVQVMSPPPDDWPYPLSTAHPVRNWDKSTYWIAGVGNAVVLFFMYQRLYVKLAVIKKAYAEDGVLILAWVFSTLTQGFIIHAFATNLLGVHFWELPVSSFVRFSYEAAYMFPIIYAPAQLFVKLGLALFYRKLSPQTWFLYAVWLLIFIIVGTYVGIFFSSVFACSPVARGWDPFIQGTCIDLGALYKATAILGVAIDVMLILIPIPVLYGLRIPLRQKVGLTLMFTVGSGTVVTSFVRYFILVNQMKQTTDSTWYSAESSGWVVVEANLSLICACLPTLRGYLRTVAPRLIGIHSFENPKSPHARNTHSNRSGSNQTPTLATIGGSNARTRMYRRFDESDLDPDIGEYGLRTIDTSKKGSREGPSDDDSEKAIIQTQTVTVTFSHPASGSSS